ncbi:MAG: hypothetical protein ACP5I8_15170 [Phycisphaerae bacterium]
MSLTSGKAVNGYVLREDERKCVLQSEVVFIRGWRIILQLICFLFGVIGLRVVYGIVSCGETMTNWTELLRHDNVIPDPCFERPFVCDGFPDASCAIIIGENPATKMDKNWWDYWDINKGFQFKKFMDDYAQARRNAGKNRMSNTRLRLNRFRESGICCVETNVYRNENVGGAGTGMSKNEAVLKVLVDNMPAPFAILACGRVAERFVCEYKSRHGGFPKQATELTSLRHLRLETYFNVDKKCREIREICPTPAPHWS